jgi:hypothetical protein
MNAPLDVYRDWLKIPDADRPLNNYQLLRLTKFEDDVAKIRKNYREMNSHVRKYSGGAFAKQSQDLLNELAKAMLCLTDARRKREYDVSLGRQAAKGDKKKQTFEELLLARAVIDANQLKKARDYAEAIGLEVRDSLVQQKLAAQDAVMEVYAESIGLPYLDVSQVTLDHALLKRVPAMIARQQSCIPVLVDEGQLLMASPNALSPDLEETLRLKTGMPVRTVLCTATSINEIINKYYTKDMAQAEVAQAASGAQAPTPKVGEAAAPKGPPGDPLKIRIAAGVGAFAITSFVAQSMFYWKWMPALGLGAAVAVAVVGLMVAMKK